MSLLCHEFFHTWNVKRIRPVELGPFDYNRENYTSMLWLAEGVTSYFDDLLTYRCGFYTQDRYLEILSENHLDALLKTPGRLQMHIKDSSFLAWTKLYLATPDSRNRFPSYYLKGGIIFWLLDILIIAETSCEKSLEDVLHLCWQHYQNSPSQGLQEDEFLAYVAEIGGETCSAALSKWLHATSELPYKDVLHRAGLEWSVEESKKKDDLSDSHAMMPKLMDAFTGLAVKEENGKLTVAASMDESPAAIAGIGVDDELLAVNNQRVTSEKHWNALMAEAASKTACVEVLLGCDGSTYTTSLQPMVKKKYSLSRVASPSAEQTAVFDTWLALPRDQMS